MKLKEIESLVMIMIVIVVPIIMILFLQAVGFVVHPTDCYLVGVVMGALMAVCARERLDESW